MIMSLSLFIAYAFTVFDAGFALKTHGSFVKGLTPFLAGDAGFFFSFKFNAPASLNEPADFNCLAAKSTMASKVSLTCLGFKPVVSATALYAPDTFKRMNCYYSPL